MDKKDIVIALPIYSETLNEVDVCAVRNTFEVAYRGGYDIAVFTFRELNTSFYDNLAKELGLSIIYEYFDKRWFRNIDTYSKLMIEPGFYQRFHSYTYMLLVQQDVWLFKDEFLDWAKRGYDYVGAPWFKRIRIGVYSDELDCVGNGGFSLRKIDTFIHVCSYSGRIHTLHDILQEFKTCNLRSIVKGVLHLLGWRNTMAYIRTKVKTVNEDLFFCKELSTSRLRLNIPSPQEALEFSFEMKPSLCYILNNHQLPMGCHAFMKHEWKEFWEGFIEI